MSSTERFNQTTYAHLLVHTFMNKGTTQIQQKVHSRDAANEYGQAAATATTEAVANTKPKSTMQEKTNSKIAFGNSNRVQANPNTCELR